VEPENVLPCSRDPVYSNYPDWGTRRDSTPNQATAAFFHILSNSLFTYPTSRSYRPTVCHMEDMTTSRHWSLSWARRIHSTLSHPISLRSILILSFHLPLGLSKSLFHSDIPTEIMYGFFICPVSAKCPVYLIILNLIILMIFGECISFIFGYIYTSHRKYFK
jgi:hypothetical protein